MSIGSLPRREKTAPDPPKSGKRWTLYAALGVVALMAVSAGWMAIRPAPAANTAGSQQIQIVNPPAAAATPGDGACGFPQAATTEPTNIVPADLVWQLNGTMAAPRSAIAGPLSTAGGIATCFEHSPSGALLAISNLIAELGNPELDMNKVVSDRLVHTTGYDQLNIRVQDWAETSKGQPDVLIRQIAGFRLITYSPDYVVIDVVQRGTGAVLAGALATQIYLLTWSGDDWKMVPPIDGVDMPSRELPTVTTPYIVFNGA